MELFLSSFGGVAADGDGDGDEDVDDTNADAYTFPCSLVRLCPPDDDGDDDDDDDDVAVELFGEYASHLPAHRYHSAHRSPGHR